MKMLAILGLALFPGGLGFAQEARFFRLRSPAAATVTSIAPSGTVTWSNSHTNITCTVQTALNLSGGTNWADYVQIPISNFVTRLRLFDLTPPSGMVFIPAGSFTMGDSLDGTSEELPLHSVYVSAFYMDRYHTTKALWDDVYQW